MVTKWILLLASFAEAALAKPRAVFILAHDDPTGVETYQAYVKKFRDCGFETKAIERKTPAGIQRALEELKPAAGTPVFVDAHGTMSRGEFHFGDKAEGDGAVLVSGKDFVSHLHKTAPGTQVWMETCYAAGCLNCEAGSIGLGASCEADATAPMNSAVISTLADLYCSRLQGCEEWYKADKNSDGRIGPGELSAYLTSRFGSGKNTRSWKVRRPEEVESAERFCNQRNGKIEKTERHTYTIDYLRTVEPAEWAPVRVQVAPNFFFGEWGERKEDDYIGTYADEKAIVQWGKEHSDDKFRVWPSRWGSQKLVRRGKTFTIYATDLKIVRQDPADQFVECTWELPKVPAPLVAPNEVVPGSYTLYGPECARGLTGRHSQGAPVDEPEH